MHFNYLTTNGNLYPLDIFVSKIAIKDMIYEPREIRELCRSGCSNFGKGGGCPPRAPLFESLFQKNQTGWFITCKFDSKFKPEKVKSSKNIAIHWKFQDGILARLLSNLGYKLSEKFNGSFLATGYCMGCPGKKCSFKIGEEKCRKPMKRTFSMEATGINVEKTVKRIFGFDLYWYTKGNTDVPYMMKCIAFFPDQEINDPNLIYSVIESLPRMSFN